MNQSKIFMSTQLGLVTLVMVLSASFLGCNREQTPTTQPVHQQPVQQQPPIVHQHQQPVQPTHTQTYRPVEPQWVNLPIHITYESGSSRLSDQNRAMLREAHASVAHRTDIVRVKVIGHSDARGNAQARRRVAQERAQHVVDFLVGDLGMPRELFEIENRGSDAPISSGSTQQDQELNRRVNFAILVRRTSAH